MDKEDYVFRNVVSDVAKFLQVSLKPQITYKKLQVLLPILNKKTTLFFFLFQGFRRALYDRSTITVPIDM